jgi:hypothetical protein
MKKFTSVGSSANFLSPKPNGQGSYDIKFKRMVSVERVCGNTVV